LFLVIVIVVIIYWDREMSRPLLHLVVIVVVIVIVVIRVEIPRTKATGIGPLSGAAATAWHLGMTRRWRTRRIRTTETSWTGEAARSRVQEVRQRPTEEEAVSEQCDEAGH
jgi:uncharacterized membrane protein